MGIRASSCLVVAFGLLLAGCPTFSNLKTARALDEGEFQFTVAPEIGVVSIPSANGVAGNAYPLPQLELAARYGVTDGFDIGAKVWIAGFELDTTISLLRGGFDLALAPGVGFFGISGSSSNSDGSNASGGFYEIPVYLPLLAGVNFGWGHQFVFGVEAIPTFVLANASSDGTSASASSVQLFLGGTVGVSFRIASSFRIMPELNLYVPVFGASSDNPGSISAFGNSGVIIFQGGLGFSFGGDGFNKYGHPAGPPM
jgi:hypothetical protein